VLNKFLAVQKYVTSFALQPRKPPGLVLTTDHISRVGQNHIYTPYMTVYLVISLPKIPYIHRVYMVLANPTYFICRSLNMLLLLQGSSGTELGGAAVPCAILTDACCKVLDKLLKVRQTLTKLQTTLFEFIKMRESLQARTFGRIRAEQPWNDVHSRLVVCCCCSKTPMAYQFLD